MSHPSFPYLSNSLVSPVISYYESLFNQTINVSYDLTNTIIKGDSLKQMCQDAFTTLSIFDLIIFGAIVVLIFEILSFVTGFLGRWVGANIVPIRGKHLDNLSLLDYVFICFSKASIVPFTFCYLKFAYEKSNIVWDMQQLSFSNGLLPIPLLFLVFDFFYTIFHWFLHFQAIYPYIHKHHHQQKAPSRGTVDAINVHPFEFLVGEFNHLFALYICSSFLTKEIHLVAVLVFSAVGGVLAGINHTRYDLEISFPWKEGKFMVFDSKDHDVHHRIPQSNYGQYTMFWDKLFGTHRPYNSNDRVNPRNQLDPKTGKTKQ